MKGIHTNVIPIWGFCLSFALAFVVLFIFVGAGNRFATIFLAIFKGLRVVVVLKRFFSIFRLRIVDFHLHCFVANLFRSGNCMKSDAD